MIEYDERDMQIGQERILLSPIDAARAVRRALERKDVYHITIRRLPDNELAMRTEMCEDTP